MDKIRNRLIVNLNALYIYRPSLVLNKAGRSVLELFLSTPNNDYLNTVDFHMDFYDGIIMSLILNFDWEKVESDIPPYLIIGQELYNDKDDFSDFICYLEENDCKFLDNYIDFLCRKRDELYNISFPINTIDKYARIKFKDDFANMQEVVIYETTAI